LTKTFSDSTNKPEGISPVKKIIVTAEDGNEVEVALRMPPGEGPFPAIIFLHGGLWRQLFDRLRIGLMKNSIHTSFLAEGYVTVAATYRTYWQCARETGAILDVLAIIDYVKKCLKLTLKASLFTVTAAVEL